MTRATSREPVTELLNPRARTGTTEIPKGLTVRKLIRHKAYAHLRARYTIVRVRPRRGEEKLACIANLLRTGVCP